MRLIDGDALKQTFCAECTHTLKCSDCDIDYHFEKLAPTIQRWIPCNERLPEEDGQYLVTVVNRWGCPETELCSFDEGDNERPFCPTNGGTNYYRKVGYPAKMTIAWMPLPEAYKEETDD